VGKLEHPSGGDADIEVAGAEMVVVVGEESCQRAAPRGPGLLKP
jgi:hypothetical protein